jgi:hypothetical protein
MDKRKTAKKTPRTMFCKLHKQCSTNPTNNVLQSPQTMFYKPYKQWSTNPTNNVLQTPQTMFYKPSKQCSTNPTNNVLQTPQTMFYKLHKQCSTNSTNNVLQTRNWNKDWATRTHENNEGEVSEDIVHLNTTDPRNAHKMVSKSVDLICVKSQCFFFFPFITWY